MALSRWKRLVRQFHENGMKLMLEDPANVRELLALAETDLIGLIDFQQLAPLKNTFVQAGYHHLESDVVMVAPLRKGRPTAGKAVWIYILIEHQSQPDRLMAFRILEYVVEVFRFQLRAGHARAGPIVPEFAGHRAGRPGASGRILRLGPAAGPAA